MQSRKSYEIQGFDPIDEGNEDLSLDSDRNTKNPKGIRRTPLSENFPKNKTVLTKNDSQSLKRKTEGKENINLSNQIPAQKSKPQKKYASQFLEEQLSGISGFSASEGEDNELFAMERGSKDHQSESSQEEEQTDSDASDEHEMPQKSRSPIAKASLRPQTAFTKAHTASENFASFKTKGLERPQTSHSQQTLNLERPGTSHSNASFKPIYTVGIQQSLIAKKIFNYNEKRFSTIPKKTDIVSRINAYKTAWKSTSFLNKNSLGSKEGRKLNLAERNQNYKQDPQNSRYVTKTAKFNHL